MVEIYNFAALDTKQQEKIARLVSLSTVIDSEKEHPLLVPVTIEEILATTDARVVLTATNSLAGYIRAKDTLVKEDDTAFRQIGTLTVLPEFQGNGVGIELVRSMTQLVLSESIPFAFVNEKSQRTFTNAGYRKADDKELPSDAKSKLGNQPMIYPRQ